jgi:hypothetical protein
MSNATATQDPKELIKFDKNKPPATYTDDDLLFAHTILHSWYEKLGRGDAVEGWTREEILDYHLLILEEMKLRGYKHTSHDQLDYDTVELVRRAEESGKDLEEPEEEDGLISLQTLGESLQSFSIRKPFVWIVGGIAVHSRSLGEIEILLQAEDFSDRARRAIQSRILGSLPPGIRDRVKFSSDAYGPSGGNVPVYALRIERMNPEFTVEEM